jgi:hypothetical protein
MGHATILDDHSGRTMGFRKLLSHSCIVMVATAVLPSYTRTYLVLVSLVYGDGMLSSFRATPALLMTASNATGVSVVQFLGNLAQIRPRVVKAPGRACEDTSHSALRRYSRRPWCERGQIPQRLLFCSSRCPGEPMASRTRLASSCHSG